jgi:hypothetical protein
VSDAAFRILALSGGGYLGLYSAAVLAALEEQAGEPIGRRSDLIAGTSVGGITAMAGGFGAGHRHRDARGGADADRVSRAHGARDRPQAAEDVLVSHWRLPNPRRFIVKPALTLGFLWAFAPSTVGALAPQDLHAYWDDRCQRCHGHAGDFARRTLRVEDGVLVGTHHARAPALQLFLKNHYLTADLLAPVTAMLTAQVTTAPLYKQHCAGCHGTAAAFARDSLSWRDGVLTGKKSGRAVAATLRMHGGLAPADAAEVVKTLARVMGEVDAE